MRIVIDTNVLISGVFFGGFPRKILSAVVSQKLTACAATEIISEYEEIMDKKFGLWYIDDIEKPDGFHNTIWLFDKRW